jgi:hypothetical protein
MADESTKAELQTPLLIAVGIPIIITIIHYLLNLVMRKVLSLLVRMYPDYNLVDKEIRDSNELSLKISVWYATIGILISPCVSLFFCGTECVASCPCAFWVLSMYIIMQTQVMMLSIFTLMGITMALYGHK